MGGGAPRATITVHIQEKDKSLPVIGENTAGYIIGRIAILAIGILVLIISKRGASRASIKGAESGIW